MKKKHLTTIVLLVIMIILLGTRIQVYAHPHMFFTSQVTYVFDEEGLAYINVVWKMDDYTSVLMFDGYDMDSDGVLSDEERLELQNDEVERIHLDGYYSNIKVNGESVAIPAITDFKVSVTANQTFIYTFTIPLTVKGTTSSTEVALAQYDKTYFTDFIVSKEQAVSVQGGSGYDLVTSTRIDNQTTFYFDQFSPEEMTITFTAKELSISEAGNEIDVSDEGANIGEVQNESSDQSEPDNHTSVAVEGIQSNEPEVSQGEGDVVGETKDTQEEGSKQEATEEEVTEEETKEQEGIAQEASEQEATQEAKEQEAKEQEAKEQEAKEQEAKEQEAKENGTSLVTEEIHNKVIDKVDDDDGLKLVQIDETKDKVSEKIESTTEKLAEQESNSLVVEKEKSIIDRIPMLQESLQFQISSLLRKAKDNNTAKPILFLLLLAFVYGAIHVAGPGHGKWLTMSYVVANGKQLKKALFLSVCIPVLHSLSGMAVVFGLSYLLQLSVLSAMDNVTQPVQLVSYGLMVILGTYIVLKNIWDLWRPLDNNRQLETKKYGVFGMALLVGMVPCPGVVFLMLFGKAYNALGLGIGMALAMMLGMVTTLTLITLITYLSRRWALNHLGKESRWMSHMESGLGILGGLMIFSYALLFFLGNFSIM